MINKYCNLNLSKDELCEIAVKIGADVPFLYMSMIVQMLLELVKLLKKFDEEF